MRSTGRWIVGGALQVGYSEDSDLLLVLSHAGRGIFDCLTGEKLARDRDDDMAVFDLTKLTVEGFGPLGGQTIRTAGLWGGGLLRATTDGWYLEERAPAWPTHTIYLSSPATLKPGRARYDEAVPIMDDAPCELRAYGFSETGRSFIMVTSCDLVIFAR